MHSFVVEKKGGGANQDHLAAQPSLALRIKNRTMKPFLMIYWISVMCKFYYAHSLGYTAKYFFLQFFWNADHGLCWNILCTIYLL